MTNVSQSATKVLSKASDTASSTFRLKVKKALQYKMEENNTALSCLVAGAGVLIAGVGLVKFA